MLKLLTPISATLLLVAWQAPAQDTGMQSNRPAYQSQSNNGQNRGNNGESPRTQSSEAVDSMLNRINGARTALQNQDQSRALADVDSALNDLQTAQQSSSNERYIPLYTELDQYSVMGPVMATRVHKNQVPSPYENQYQNSVDRDKLRAAHQAHAEAFTQAGGQYTSVVIDTQVAREDLQRARQALKNHDAQSADQALNELQQSVKVQSASGDLPLLRARENLILAQAAANSGDYEEARGALLTASKALGKYANGNSPHAEQARDLESQIEHYRLDSTSADSAVNGKIRQWWNETAGWVNSNENLTSASNGHSSQQ